MGGNSVNIFRDVNEWLLEYVPDNNNNVIFILCLVIYLSLFLLKIRNVPEYPLNFWFMPDHLKTQEMCDKAVDKDPNLFKYVPDQSKTQEMCNKAVDKDSEMLMCVPDHLKTHEMCDKAVSENPANL